MRCGNWLRFASAAIKGHDHEPMGNMITCEVNAGQQMNAEKEFR